MFSFIRLALGASIFLSSSAEDFPMMDAPDPIPNPSPAQRFSIVDVLRNNETGEPKDMTTTGGSCSSTDPMHSNLYECDEAKVLQRLQKLYPHTDLQKLPRHWNRNDRWMPAAVVQQQAGNVPTVSSAQVLELSSDLLRVTKRKGDTKNSKDAAAVRANRPIPRSSIVFYYEITVVNKGTGGYMGIGLSEKLVSLNRLPGWDQTSYGYHGDDGNFFASSGKGVEYGPTFTTGDVVGCGLNFVKREMFFTKNGRHLGVANVFPVPLINDLYPTVGMQTADEMIDTNFGQRPFMFDIVTEMEAAELATKEAIAAIELPAEKVLWMNSLIAKWMTHEGYARTLEALNRTTAEPKASSTDSAVSGQTATKEERQGSSSFSSAASIISNNKKESSPPTTAAAAETVANSVMQSIIVFGAGAGGGAASSSDNSNDAVSNMSNASVTTTTTTGPSSLAASAAAAAAAAKRRTVVRSVQEALHEEMEHDRMEQRRTVIRMVKRGQLTDAIKQIEQHYPTLMEANRQLALLLKVQQFVEMLSIVTKEMPPSSPPATTSSHEHNNNNNNSNNNNSNFMDIAEDSRDGYTSMDTTTASVAAAAVATDDDNDNDDDDDLLLMMANGNSNNNNSNSAAALGSRHATNGNAAATSSSSSLLLVGTPPTSTTIVDEPASDEIDLFTDGMTMDFADEQQQQQSHHHHHHQQKQQQDDAHGGFTNGEERDQFERYRNLLEFGHHISQFALKMDADDGPCQGSVQLRQRMNEAFSLLCYQDPTQSSHAYLFDQIERDLVAKALNAAILEMEGNESVSPLDKCFRRARYIREQALAFSASSIFADPSHLFDEEKIFPTKKNRTS